MHVLVVEDTVCVCVWDEEDVLGIPHGKTSASTGRVKTATLLCYERDKSPPHEQKCIQTEVQTKSRLKNATKDRICLLYLFISFQNKEINDAL
jgi:hypothetical protein